MYQFFYGEQTLPLSSIFYYVSFMHVSAQKCCGWGCGCRRMCAPPGVTEWPSKLLITVSTEWLGTLMIKLPAVLPSTLMITLSTEWPGTLMITLST